MKHFLRMNSIETRVSTKGLSVLTKRLFQKLIFYSLLFSSVFSIHLFYGGQSSEIPPLGGAVVAFALSDTLPSKEGAGHQTLLDINKASSDELIALPGIGPKLAELIMKDREANGPFQDANALLRVKGIGQKKLEKISPFLQFDSAAAQ